MALGLGRLSSPLNGNAERQNNETHLQNENRAIVTIVKGILS